MKKITGTMLMILGFLISAQAQDAKFTVEISSDTVLMGNYFELKFTLENITGKFEAPDLGEFRIVGGPNTSTSMSIINGEVKRSSSYSYYLQPPDFGNYIIPPAFVDTGEGILETVPLEIISVPNPDGIVQHPNRPGLKFEDYLRDKSEDEKGSGKPSRPRKRF